MSDEDLTTRYRIWFFFYKNKQILWHKIGLHTKQKHYSIAPRCDWCGYRNKKQRAIAKRNRLYVDRYGQR